MKKQKIIFFTTAIVAVIPLLVLGIIYLIKSENFFEENFWLSYMTYFGTIAVSGTSLWQQALLEDQSRKLQEDQQNQEIILENMTTEHPLFKIKSVSLYGAVGRKLVERYQSSEHQENYFLGAKIKGYLEIKVENIGNGLAHKIEHFGLDSFHAKENSHFLYH